MKTNYTALLNYPNIGLTAHNHSQVLNSLSWKDVYDESTDVQQTQQLFYSEQ